MKKPCFLIVAICIAIQSRAQWTTSGANIYNSNSGYTGIGTMTPGYKLDVAGGWIHGSAGVLSEVSIPGSICGWFRGAPNGNSNIVMQANAGGGAAFWMTAQPSMLLIGTAGGAEPAVGAINITQSGNVGIGTLNPGSNRLSVEGTLGARAVKVTLATPWPDYVFARKYRLISLSELDNYIKRNKHLPDVPSSNDVRSNGIDLGNMNAELLKKIEELTLFVIDLKKENEKIKSDLTALSKKQRSAY